MSLLHQSPSDHATRWSLVARAVSPEDAGTRAMDELLRIYLPVLQGMLARWPQLDASTKEDLLQSFVQKRILENQLLAKADATKGRFRSFLLKAFQNHIVDEIRKSTGAKYSPGAENLLSYDELAESLGHSAELEKAYHVAWVRNLVEEGSRRLHADCMAKGRNDLWLVFQERLQKPFLEGSAAMPYEELVQRLELSSPSQASNLLISSKRQLRKILEALINETVEDPSEMEAEWDFLKKCLK
ncbi:hypothetical protein P3T73_18315 [Kiritimatiellota bacterium B12222]|nr:hypothetical protein P3T73_18315 [Kiritimatiellota bacterium B12222]